MTIDLIKSGIPAQLVIGLDSIKDVKIYLAIIKTMSLKEISEVSGVDTDYVFEFIRALDIVSRSY